MNLLATLDTSHSTRLLGLSRIIGNTPLLEISFQFRGKQRVIYAKFEQLNLTGSIKDRMALHILKEAYRSGQLRSGDTIAEATSRNTGISVAAIGRALGHPVKIFMPNWMSRERQELIRSYGAEIVLVSSEQADFWAASAWRKSSRPAAPAFSYPASFQTRLTQRHTQQQLDRKSGLSWSWPTFAPMPLWQELEPAVR